MNLLSRVTYVQKEGLCTIICFPCSPFIEKDKLLLYLPSEYKRARMVIYYIKWDVKKSNSREVQGRVVIKIIFFFKNNFALDCEF